MTQTKTATARMTDHPLTDKQKLELLLSKIQQSANYKHCIDECGDDYNPSEFKSHDDAFEDGSGYGQVEFARELLRYIADKPEAQ